MLVVASLGKKWKKSPDSLKKTLNFETVNSANVIHDDISWCKNIWSNGLLMIKDDREWDETWEGDMQLRATGQI